MMRLARELRLIPVVLLATICLFVLKVLGIVLDGGYVLTDTEPAKTDRLVIESGANAPAPHDRAADGGERRRQPWAQEMFNFPGAGGSDAASPPEPKMDPDAALVTGSVADSPAAAANKAPEPKDGKPAPAAPPQPPPVNGTPVPLDANRPSAGERAVLESLGERRQELDERAREIDIRENLVKSAEQRLQERTNELKRLEGRINAAADKKNENQALQLKSLVVMYENMKAKDAAKIFDRLDMKVLIQVVSLINPRRMADILGQMQPEVAERLTVEIANRAGIAAQALTGSDLPKIEGRPPAAQ